MRRCGGVDAVLAAVGDGGVGEALAVVGVQRHRMLGLAAGIGLAVPPVPGTARDEGAIALCPVSPVELASFDEGLCHLLG